MTTKLEELQEKVNFWLHWLAIVVTSAVLAVVVTIIYWIVEPDPLTVDKVGVEHQRYFNKNGVKGLDESVNQLMIKREF